MMSWKDIAMAQEHSKDLLREAEAARLIRQFNAGNGGTNLWQKVKNFFAGSREKEAPIDEPVYCCSADAIASQ
jgi:hypothetical protein